MELYAVCYGQGFRYGTRGTVLRGCEHPDEKVGDFVFLFYIIFYEGKRILVDVGFHDEKLATNMGIELFEVRGEVERILGGSKPDLIILTHEHWDHVNALGDYAGVPIVLCKVCKKLLEEECEEKGVLEALKAGELICVEKSLQLEDCFTFEWIGGHTKASCVLWFTYKGKRYVITGDECYNCENIYANIPIGICENERYNEEFIRRAHEGGWIPLPFHDGRILRESERISEHIVRVIG